MLRLDVLQRGGVDEDSAKEDEILFVVDTRTPVSSHTSSCVRNSIRSLIYLLLFPVFGRAVTLSARAVAHPLHRFVHRFCGPLRYRSRGDGSSVKQRAQPVMLGDGRYLICVRVPQRASSIATRLAEALALHRKGESLSTRGRDDLAMHLLP